MSLTRRTLFGAAMAATLVSVPGVARTAAPRIFPAARRWGPPPSQLPAEERLVEVPGARLWCWDTGGPGEPVIFLHPGTGSGLIWAYQQPVFAKAGYRVIGYSRRGHARSESGDPDKPGTGADDLARLADALKIDRFHLVGSAAGGFIVPDFALSYPDRLISMTLACTQGGVVEPSYRAIIATLTPDGYFRMPESFRELGPSYRSGYPEGVKAWEALEHHSRSGPKRIQQAMKNRLLWPAIETIKTPSLIFTGAADLYMPPTLMLDYASHLQNAEVAIISESGHSAYWEQPEAFNQLVLNFIRKHRRR